jgi:hypothetical protein
MDSPWDESADNSFKDIEWSRISAEFTNVGFFISKKSTTVPAFPNRSVIARELQQERRQPYKKDLILVLLMLEHQLVEN